MIDIIKLISANKYYGGGDFIEIAKGKHKQITTFKEAKEKIKRICRSKKK